MRANNYKNLTRHDRKGGWWGGGHGHPIVSIIPIAIQSVWAWTPCYVKSLYERNGDTETEIKGLDTLS